MKRLFIIVLLALSLIMIPNIAYGGIEESSNTYNVTISWGDMLFSYVNNTSWDTNSLTYIENGLSKWTEKTPDSSGNISISNSSNCDVRIGTSFVANTDGIMNNINGLFYFKKNSNYYYTSHVNHAIFSMDSMVDTTPSTKIIKFMPSGFPITPWLGEKNVGTITIQLYSTDSTGLQLSEESTTIEYGDTKQLNVLNNSGSITWETANSDIASVNDSGLVTAKGVGKTTIKATVDGITLECNVTIISKKEVALSRKSISLFPNETSTIELIGATSAPEWSSCNTSVANITNTSTADGYTATITAYEAGTTLIKAILNDEVFYIKVHVINPKDEGESCDHMWIIVAEEEATHYNDGRYILQCTKCGATKTETGDVKVSHTSKWLTEGRISWINTNASTSYPFISIGKHGWQSSNQGVHSSMSTGKWNITVDKDTTINIPYSVSSEGNNDKFSITIDGENKVNEISGELSGTITTTLNSGEHTLETVYSKNESGNSYNDTAHIELYETKCEECGHVHDFTKQIIQEVTLSTEGIVEYTCSKCHIVFRENIPKANYKITYTTTESTETELVKYFYNMNDVKELINTVDLKTISIENTTTNTEAIDCSHLFENKANLETIDLSNFHTNYAKYSMCMMFYNCSSLTTLNVSNFDTSKVTDMYSMFGNCKKLASLNISSFDTSKVTSMHGMFSGCENLTSLDVSGFDTSSVTDIGMMFNNCASLTTLDVSNFNTSKVTDIHAMFNYCKNLTSLNISNFNTSEVTDISYMFYGCSSLTTLNVSNLNTSNVTNMAGMFEGCSKLTSLDLSNFDTKKVINMEKMFCKCTSLKTIYVSDSWTVDNVTFSDNMFTSDTKLVGEISYDSSCVDKTYAKYQNGYLTKAPAYKATYSTSTKTDAVEYFDDFDTLKSFISTNKTALTRIKIEDGPYAKNQTNLSAKNMFNGCSNIQSIDLSKLSTTNITDMYAMFNGCSALTSLDLHNFNTSNVTNMSAMFYNCNKLTELNLSSFDTSKVTNMAKMFGQCKSLTSLDLSSFNTLNVLYMQGMFTSCSELQKIYVSNNWTVTNISNLDRGANMFSGCDNLVGAISYNSSNVDCNYANYQTGYLTKAPAYKATYSTSTETDAVEYFDDFATLKSFISTNKTALTRIKIEDGPYAKNQTNLSAKDMFKECSNIQSIDLSKLSTTNITDMSAMFSGCSALTSLDLHNFNTSNVTEMNGMFFNCNNLSNIDVSHFDTSKVIYMDNMFESCNKLTSLDLASFDTSNVIKMDYLFKDCSSLNNIYVSNKWNASNVTSSLEMFSGCTSLNNYSSDKVDITYAHTGTNGYLTLK